MSDESAFTFLPLGAIIQEFKVGGINIVQGFRTQEDYVKYNTPHFGATIGRVANRLKQDYAHVEDTEIYKKKTREDADALAMREKEEVLAGGFLPEGHDEDDEEAAAAPPRASNYFPVAEDGEEDDEDDPFEIE